MKRLGSVILVILMLGFWQAGTPRNVYACSCASPPEPIDALERAGAVFNGIVVDIKDEPAAGPLQRAVTFDIISTWKGTSEAQIVVYTGMNDADCGFNFEVGKRYLVYTYDNEAGRPNASKPNTGLCDRTKLLTAAGEDIAKLGPGKRPVANPAVQATPQAGGQPTAQATATAQPGAVKREQATFIPYVIPIAAVMVIFLVIYMVMFRGKRA